MNDELKPCPFCGGTPIVSGCDDTLWSVICKKCAASIDYNETKQEAIEEWNRRVQPTFTPDELDAIRRNVRDWRAETRRRIMDWVQFYGVLAIMLVVGGVVRIFNGDLNIGLGLALLGLIAYLANGELWKRRLTNNINVKINKTEVKDD